MANSTRPLATVQEATVLTLRTPLHAAQQSQTKYQVLLTTTGLARVSLCSVLTGVTVQASGNDREGDLRTLSRRTDRARGRLPGVQPGSLFSGTLLPFSVCSRRPGMRAQTVLFRVGSFQSLGPLITRRSLSLADSLMLSEASCPRTHGLYQPLPASSRMACLWPRHSDSPTFGQRGHPGGVTRLFRARGLQRLGCS